MRAGLVRAMLYQGFQETTMKRLQAFVPAALVLGLAFSATGCVVSGSARMHGHGGAYVQPSTVMISPGVYVVEDYDRSVLYSDGYYWQYEGGVWYRSGYHDRGWVRWHNVPHGIARVDNPRGYVRYRGGGQVRGGGRGNVRNERPTVRDQRDGRVRGGGNSVGPSRGGVRDHRGATPVRVQKPNVDNRGSGQVRHKNDGGAKKKSGVKVRDRR